jgi:hypothetical protein
MRLCERRGDPDSYTNSFSICVYLRVSAVPMNNPV